MAGVTMNDIWYWLFNGFLIVMFLLFAASSIYMCLSLIVQEVKKWLA